MDQCKQLKISKYGCLWIFEVVGTKCNQKKLTQCSFDPLSPKRTFYRDLFSAAISSIKLVQ